VESQGRLFARSERARASAAVSVRFPKFTSHLRHIQEALDGNSFAFK
jgi:hypothetical protein